LQPCPSETATCLASPSGFDASQPDPPADAVRAGRLEAGLVALPIDDGGREVGASVAQFEVVYESTERDGLNDPSTSSRGLARSVSARSRTIPASSSASTRICDGPAS
jgi:hypothetical protein